ncbi:MAG: OmpH family outer membrane protein [Acidobacteriota bacterium]
MIATVLSLGLAVSAVSAQTPAAPAAPRPTAPAAPRPAAPAPQAPAAQAPPVVAPTPVAAPFPADAKIAFINMQLIVGQSKLGKSGQDKMKELNDRKSGELATQNKQVQTLQQEIAAGQAVLSATVLAQKNAELDRITRETQFKQEQAQADVQALNDQLLEEFQAKVLPIIEQVRSEKNLWVIFSTGDAGVAAMHAGLDLSQEVIKRLDASK